MLHTAVIELPADLMSRVRAHADGRDLEPTILELISTGLKTAEKLREQEALLQTMARRRFTPPPGTPESAEWLREDRDR